MAFSSRVFFVFALATGVAFPWSARGDEDEKIIHPDRTLYDPGKYVYERNCIVCHGERGDGKGEMSAQLNPKPRSFVQGLFKYRSTPFGKLPTDADLKRTISGGIGGTAMGMFTNLTDDDLTAVVEYIKFFSRRWRHAENYGEALKIPDLPEWVSNAGELKKHAASGKGIFESTCAVCHGPAGDGKGPGAAGLKDEWGFAVTPADLRQPHLRSGSDLRDIFRVLMTGLNGTPMASFADTLSADQKWDVIAYVAELRRLFAEQSETAKKN